MSPEQARGQAVDKRTDIWAFGCVLYEMLAGRTPFPGQTISDTLAAIDGREPDWSALPNATPHGVRRILRRCLQKDQKTRSHDIADVRIDLDEAMAGSADETHRDRPQTAAFKAWLPWASTACLALVAALALWFSRSVTPPIETRVDIATPPTTDPVSLAISPDGRAIAFVGTSGGQPRLWLRSLGTAAAHPLSGTDQASHPFWSPDSRSLGFFAGGRLKRLDLQSGSVRVLANTPFATGGTWNRAGVILFAPSDGAPISRVADTGGEVVAVSRIERPEQSNHRSPQFLPDGRRFLYYVTGTAEARGVYVADLDGSQTRRVLDADTVAIPTASGQLLFVRQQTLYAQAVDQDRLTLVGSPVPVATDVAVSPFNLAPVSASLAGPIVYRAAAREGQRQFMWFDRAGHELVKLGEPDDTSPLSPSISPDERQVVLYRTRDGNTDIWLLDTSRGVMTRFTFDTTNEINPIWSSDGKSIAYAKNRTGVFDLFLKAGAGTGSEDLLLSDSETKAPMDWSPDARFLLYRRLDSKLRYDIWAISVDERRPFPVVRTNFDEREAQFSPDGQRIAYQSNESGRSEIYVQSFPDPKSKAQVSANGGAQARWRRDGMELFYIALDGQLMSVPILRRSGTTFEAGTPVPLFLTHIGGALLGPRKQQYVVSADGQRFLMNTLLHESPSPISMILNWRGQP